MGISEWSGRKNGPPAPHSAKVAGLAPARCSPVRVSVRVTAKTLQQCDHASEAVSKAQRCVGTVKAMRALDLETRVISAVERIRAGEQVENDLIECKRDWPTEDKARQLAGSLNRANGDPVIYIVGVDDRTGDVHPLSNTDVLDWWSQMETRFDQLPPEMVRQISVPVGNRGEHVVAIAFASDRAPYLVKTGSAKPSLEIPIREGTGTRTARRDELLRLLIPAATVPNAMILTADLNIDHYAPQAEDYTFGIEARGEMLDAYCWVRVYFEHAGASLLTLPTHGMSGSLQIGSQMLPLKVRQGPAPSGDEKRKSAGRGYGVTLDGPDGVMFEARLPTLDMEDLPTFETAEAVHMRLDFEVLHAPRVLSLRATLEREPEDPKNEPTEHQRKVGKWSVGHPGLWEG